jgi:SAM-dependent methyltransferase
MLARVTHDSSFSYSGTELDALAGAQNYYRWIYRRFAPFLGRRIVEIGSGVGTLADILLKGGSPEEMILVEPASNLFPVLRERFAAEPRVTLINGYAEAIPATVSADSIILVNVLEHIADAQGLLAFLHTRLVGRGRLLILVPAGPRLFGSLDRAFGHYRRYTASSLTDSLQGSGFTITSLQYFNLPGVISWFIAGKVLRKTTLSRRDVQLYDRWIVPWISALESVWVPPFGQSLIAISERRTPT